MARILEEFAYGNVSPEARFFRKDSRYSRAIELTARVERELMARLEGEDRALFKRYVDAQGEANQLTAVSNLVYGYKLGLIMTAEAFTGMDDLYAGGEEL